VEVTLDPTRPRCSWPGLCKGKQKWAGLWCFKSRSRRRGVLGGGRSSFPTSYGTWTSAVFVHYLACRWPL